MDYSQRLIRFRQRLDADLAFFPISSDLNYLTGVPRDVPNFGAVLHPGAWLEGAWITPRHDPVLTLPRMTAEFGGLERLQGVQMRVLGDWDDPASLVRDILKGFALPPKPRVAVSHWTEGETLIHLQAILPDAVFVSATDILRKMRVIKSEEEAAVMREAGRITEAAFADVIPLLKHGMTELEVIAEVDYQLKKHGSLGPSFTTSLYNSGPNHELIFGDREKKWHRPLHPPVSVLFDFGAVHDGFCYDYGRTVSFGAPDPAFQQVYDLVMASQAAGIAAMKAGQVTAEQVDAAARRVIADAGFGAEFRHRLGHGIGMDVHEPPFLTKGDTTVLQEGMWFTVEPSIMRYGGFSSRVEDVVVVRPGGGEKLTNGWQSLIVID
ncbi:MAG: aminopeptidase P family protein [Anaerolineae bacterium]|nr:aminopeptidase P family protein [Anaerolineae bacterium]